MFASSSRRVSPDGARVLHWVRKPLRHRHSWRRSAANPRRFQSPFGRTCLTLPIYGDGLAVDAKGDDGYWQQGLGPGGRRSCIARRA